ncbi:hypothetical protein [Bacillus toyonensis]|uniref:Uncharacterized protein n=1 Tax=Bacillus toyonensis TaxID=155322 RepID=A0A2B5Y7V5_9BACI|nr:hypothetical protein [Bacillus toyonensis]PGB04695.1 hypothetical protein COL93_00830 [Bacillus toyonensis]PHD66952.1 hypothetical protein COF40_20490 [Bacillus toyonensis]
MDTVNKILGRNIQAFLESRDLDKVWVRKRADIEERIFDDMLSGKEKIDIYVYVAKINKLFGIKDPAYFYQTNFNYTKPRNQLNCKEDFLEYISSSPKGNGTLELNEEFEVFFEFVELIDILKATTKY